jgi:hypothetical protein
VQAEDLIVGRNPHAPTFPDRGFRSLNRRVVR